MLRTTSKDAFIFPLDGVMLTYAAGENVDGKLKIKAVVDANENRNIYLNGEKMTETMHGIYKKEIILEDYKNTLVMYDETTGQREKIDVYFLKKGFKAYRFSLDDNIWFLQNLTINKDNYKSCFEDPYLKLLKTMHDKYGTKYHVNIYYETPHLGGFNLTQMTDKFKPEFIANSDWLRFSFHANADKPDRPYAHTTYEQAKFECERINKEIIRFAGEEAFAKTVMTVHWGDCSVEAARAFRDCGYKAFVASFAHNKMDGVDIRMYFDAEMCELMQRFGFYYDKEEDMYFFRYNGGIQRADPAKIRAQFDSQDAAQPYYKFKDICLHEQYFYPEYKNYMPDYYEKMDAACGWCYDHGYTPIFGDELFEFNTH